MGFPNFASNVPTFNSKPNYGQGGNDIFGVLPWSKGGGAGGGYFGGGGGGGGGGSSVVPTSGPVGPHPGGLKGYIQDGGQVNMNSLVANTPDYQSILKGDGSFKDGFEFDPKMISYKNLDSYDAYKNFALGSGPSDMYKSQARLIDLQGQQGMNQMREENARGVASGMSALATSGGLDSGSRERLAARGNSDRLRAAQGISAGVAQGKAQAGAQDAQNRYAALQGLTQMDTQRRTLNTGIANNGMMTNLNNRMGDVRGSNAYGLEQFGQIGNIYGSEMNARAMEAAANKENPGLLGMGGFLGTGIGGNQGLLGTGILGGGKLVDTSRW